VPRTENAGRTVSLKDKHESMLLIRAFEEAAIELRHAREIVGPVHPYIGQEAIAAGVCLELAGGDRVVSHYRGHGHAISLGCSLRQLCAELLGREAGVCRGWAAGLVTDLNQGLLLSSGVVGAGAPIAAGAAVGAQLEGRGRVVAVFMGDGAFGAGVVHETLNLAVVQRLPIVFICENNGYQGPTRTEEVSSTTKFWKIAAAHGMAAIPVDGNDVEAMSEAARHGIERARTGSGPTFLDAQTYLTRFHLTFDKPSNERRPKAEMEAWIERDPLGRSRRRLQEEGLDERTMLGMEQGVRQSVDEAFEWARQQAWATTFPNDGAWE
jgi:TPP-dependent pyruvate/acetoin dehydrogenase alpha subunit